MTDERLFDRAVWRLAPGRDAPRWLPRVVTSIWLLCFVAGIGYALIQPVWSVVDEGPHYGYVELVAEHGRFPRAGETVVSEQVLAIGRDRQWGWQYPRDATLEVEGEGAPVGTGRADESEWIRENLWRFNYEAIQPPAYYVTSAVVYRIAPAGALDKVYAIRILAAFFASLNVLFAYRIARRISPRSRILQIGAPASFILLQGYMLNLSQVTNDAMAAAIGGGLTLILVVVSQEEVGRKRAIGIGALLGLGLLTKSVLWVFPAIFVIVYWKRFGLRGAIDRLKWTVAVSSAMFIPWLLRNLLVYGEVTGQSRMSRFLGTFFPAPTLTGAGTIWRYVSSSARHLVLSYAWGEPVWVWANRSTNAIALYLVLAATSVGWVSFAIQRRRIRGLEHHPSVGDSGIGDNLSEGGVGEGGTGAADQTPELDGPVSVERGERPPRRPADRRVRPAGTGPGAMRAESAARTWVAPLLERPGMWICGLVILICFGFLMVLPLLGGIAVVGRYMYPVSAAAAVVITFGVARAVPRPKLRVAFLLAIAVGFLALNVVNLVGWQQTGLTTSRVADGFAYSNGTPEPATRWYFAAGRNEGGYTELFSIFNPTASHGSATLSYFTGGGHVSKRSVEVPAKETVIINTRFDRAGGAGAGHLTMGTIVDGDVPIVVERSEFFFVSDRGWNGGSVTVGQKSPATEGWFVAGQVGGGYSEIISFLNPDDEPTRVTLEYLADGRVRESNVVVPARSPLRIDVSSPENGGFGERADRLSIHFRSARPIVAERQLYYATGGYAGGDWSGPAMPSVSSTFPAINGSAGFHPTLTLFNPDSAGVEVALTYTNSDGDHFERTARANPGRTDVDLDIATGAGVGVVSGAYALQIVSPTPVVAEIENLIREGGYADATVQTGVIAPSRSWYYAAGSTHPDFEQQIWIFNPTPRETVVKLTYGPARPANLPSEHLASVTQMVVLKPGELLSIPVRQGALGVGASQDLSTLIEADEPVFAGRALFFIHSF